MLTDIIYTQLFLEVICKQKISTWLYFKYVLMATSKTWTQTLDLDPEKSGPRKTWTLKNLDPKKPGP